MQPLPDPVNIGASTPRHSGFTLTEMAIVLVVVALLLGGLLVSLTGQRDIANTKETQKRLETIAEALIGFAAANGRLPCPATEVPNTNGQESPVGGGTCTTAHRGFVPAATLGITPVDDQGFAIDAWGNRIRYAVSSDPSGANMATNAGGAQRWSLTTVDGIKNLAGGFNGLHPDLHVCDQGPASATAQCPNITLTSSAVAVVYSTGRNTGTGGTGADEAENPNPASAVGDRLFVSHVPAPVTAANGEFDDIVVWISPNILFSRMISAGKLP